MEKQSNKNRGFLKAVKNWFVDVFRKEKVVENKPVEQMDEERNLFYRIPRKTTGACPYFTTQKEAKIRRKRKVRNRMERKSRKLNRVY